MVCTAVTSVLSCRQIMPSLNIQNTLQTAWVADTAGTPTITQCLQGLKREHQQENIILRCIYSHNPSHSLCCEQRSAEILKGLKNVLTCLGATGLQLLSSSELLPFAWLAALIREKRDAVRYRPVSCTSPGTDNESVSAHHSWHPS